MREYGDLPVFVAPQRADHRRGAALAGKRRYRRDRLQRRGPAQPATVPAVEHRPAQPAGRGRCYSMFGALSTTSSLASVLHEIETLAGNVIRATEVYAGYLKAGPEEDTITDGMEQAAERPARRSQRELARRSSTARRCASSTRRSATPTSNCASRGKRWPRSWPATAWPRSASRRARPRSPVRAIRDQGTGGPATRAGQEVAEKIATLENQLEGERAQVAELPPA